MRFHMPFPRRGGSARPMSPRRRRRRLFLKVFGAVVLGAVILAAIISSPKKKKPDPVLPEPEVQEQALPAETAQPVVPEPVREVMQTPAIMGVVCIDPGHGFSDSGVYTPLLGSQSEKDIVLDVALMLKSKLERAGYFVVMTRDGDYNDEAGLSSLDSSARADTANQNEAQLFISLHCDSYPADTSVSGPHIYYIEESSENVQLLIDGLSSAYEDVFGVSPPVTSKTEKSAVSVLRRVEMPAAFISLGYVSNPEEAAALLTSATREKAAEALALGIENYFKAYEKSEAEKFAAASAQNN